MGATATVCKPSTTTPPDYSKQLSPGVPPVERAPTSLFPFQSIGPGDVTWYFPIDVGTGFKATGVFILPRQIREQMAADKAAHGR